MIRQKLWQLHSYEIIFWQHVSFKCIWQKLLLLDWTKHFEKDWYGKAVLPVEWKYSIRHRQHRPDQIQLNIFMLTKYNLRSTDKYAIPQTKPDLYSFQRVQYMIEPTWPEPAPTTMVWWNSIRSSPTWNIVLETGKTTTAKHQHKITKTTITKQKHQAQAPSGPIRNWEQKNNNNNTCQIDWNNHKNKT